MLPEDWEVKSGEIGKNYRQGQHLQDTDREDYFSNSTISWVKTTDLNSLINETH